MAKSSRAAGRAPFSAPGGAAQPFKCRPAGPDRLLGGLGGGNRAGRGGTGRGCGRGWLEGAPWNHLSPKAFFPTLSPPPTFTLLPLTPRFATPRYPRNSPLRPNLNLVSLSGAGVVWPRLRRDRSGTRSPLTPSRRQHPRSTLPSAGRPSRGITRISVLGTIEGRPVLTWLQAQSCLVRP